jgi:hypothetical protein
MSVLRLALMIIGGILSQDIIADPGAFRNRR